MPRHYKLTFGTLGRIETSVHKTRHAVMKAAYDRLDLEQRDAYALREQALVDDIGRERAVMACHYAAVVRGRGGVTLYNHGRVRVTAVRQ